MYAEPQDDYEDYQPDNYDEPSPIDNDEVSFCEVCRVPLYWNGEPTHICPHPPKNVSWFERFFSFSTEHYCKLCGHLHSAHVKWPDDSAEREAWRRLSGLIAIDFITGVDPF